MPGDHVKTLFKKSNALPVPSLFDALLLFGLPPVDHGIFDRSWWCGPSKLSDSDSDPSRQIMSLQRRDFSFYYQGNNLGLIMQRLSVNLRRELSEGCGDNGWTFMPDLYSFLLTATFRAIVEALYGEHILRVCPSLAQDFWQFYAAMPTIAKGFPEWLSPTAYKSRRNMIINFSNWRSWCAKHFDPKTVPVNYEYEPIWGTLLVRRMVERYEELGFSNEGVSSALLGFLFVYVTQSSTGIWRLAIDKPSTVANSIPAAVWMVLHILLSPGLQSRLDPGFNAAFNRNSGSMQIDKLLGMPLLNSIYCETLRLHAAGTIGRKSTSDFELPGGWTIRHNTPIMSANWLGGIDETFWNTGPVLSDGTPKHPLDKFWAERFLLYKDDPISGPFRQPAYLRQGSLPIPEASEKRDRDAKLVTSGLHGNWFPFGGGASRCPGEAMAKQTMFATTAITLRFLQIELDDPLTASQTKSYHRTLPFGTLSFDRAVPIQMRRRRESGIPPPPGPPPDRPLPPLPEQEP